VPQINTSKAHEPSVEIKAQRVSKPLRWPTTHRCPHTTVFVCACVSGGQCCASYFQTVIH